MNGRKAVRIRKQFTPLCSSLIVPRYNLSSARAAALGSLTRMSEETSKTQSGSGDDRGRGGMGGGNAFPRGDKDAPEGGRPFKNKRRRKVSYLTTNKIDTVDYKEINILRRFLNDRGKIFPSRQSGNTAKQQRMIASAIRKAREMALLPFVVKEMGSDRRDYRPRPDRYSDRGPRNNDQQQQAPAAAAEAPAAE